MTSIVRLIFVIFTLFFATFVNGEIEARHGSFSAGIRQNFLNKDSTTRNYIVNPPSYNDKHESHHHIGFGDQGIVQSENNNNNNNFNNNNNNNQWSRSTTRTTTRRQRYNYNGNRGFNSGNNGFNQHQQHNQHRHRHYYDNEDDQPTWGSSNVNNRVEAEKDSREKN